MQTIKKGIYIVTIKENNQNADHSKGKHNKKGEHGLL